MLGLHVSDADTEIDGEWLLSVGFVASPIECSGDPNEGIPPHTSYEYRIDVPFEDYESQEEGDGKWLSLELPGPVFENEMCELVLFNVTGGGDREIFIRFPHTRGELRCLCRSLGVALKEPASC